MNQDFGTVVVPDSSKAGLLFVVRNVASKAGLVSGGELSLLNGTLEHESGGE